MLWLPFQPISAAVNNPPLPQGYKTYLADPGYLKREATTQSGFTLVGQPDCTGVSWQYGPVKFERYVSDVEPKYDPTGPWRLVTWQRVNSNEIPRGWKTTRLVMNTSRTGFATIDGAADYFKKWDSHAQRHRKTWLKQANDWEIVPITVDEYIAAYKRSKQDAFLKFLFSNMLKQKAKGHGALLHIVGARHKTPHSQVEAGFAFIDVPETQQSIHLMSFHSEEAKKVSVGTGLMDYWFLRSPEFGIKYLEFGCFWTPGEPKSWQGFSKFKAQFGLQFTDYPQPLARFMGQSPIAKLKK